LELSKVSTQFNQIFKNRDINGLITGYIPVYDDSKNRIEEIMKFITEREIDEFIIIDDDHSLNSLEKEHKSKLVLTNQMIGFNEENLKLALEIIGR